MSTYRYPGAPPFRTDQRHIFFGRGNDISRFFQFMQLEKLTVLYSRSGLGKSSLLKAGIIPKIVEESDLEPIAIRFLSYTDDQTHRPLDVTYSRLREEEPEERFLSKLIPEELSLWSLLKTRQLGNIPEKAGFVLIFDQFEEFFTYPKADQEAFKRELAELLYTAIPQRVLEKIRPQIEGEEDLLAPEEISALHRPFTIKCILAIRSDRLHLLNGLSDQLPGAMNHCYELGPLSLEEAEDAIICPAYSKAPGFRSPPFDYTDEAVEKMLDFLTQHGTQSIESFQLQLLCQSVERKVVEKDLGVIHIDDLGDINALYENYYENQISQIKDKKDRGAARRFVEEGLIFEQDERRLSLYEGQITKEYGIGPKVLEQLVDTYLIRAEQSTRGGLVYELSHDTLVAPILKAKKKRLEMERQEAEALARRVREEELQKERKKRRRAVMWAVLNFLVAVIAVIFFIQAERAKDRAQLQQDRAQNQEKVANQYLVRYLTSDAERFGLQIKRYEEDIETLEKSGDSTLVDYKVQLIGSLRDSLRNIDSLRHSIKLELE